MSQQPHSQDSGSVSTGASSRRVYLMRRAAGFLLLIILIDLIFTLDGTRHWLFDLGCAVVAVVLWLLADKINNSYRRPAESMDENGNAKKKVL